MESFIQALVVAFREGLEAFLIIAILIRFLDKSGNKGLKPRVWWGTAAGIAGSVVFGLILWSISSLIGGTGNAAKLWESSASFLAVMLITTFIIWMITHGSRIKEHVESQASLNLSKAGIFLIAMVMVAREGAEIAIFSFAGKYEALPIILGVAGSVVLVLLVFHSIVNIPLRTLFGITLAYLILQAGFLVGYSIHEGLSASKGLGLIEGDNPLFSKAFDASGGVLDHKAGAVGLPLNVALGWYAKPEWVQFFAQYAYTFLLFGFWYVWGNRRPY